jgi:hypothetical protein
MSSRQHFWPEPTALKTKLWGTAGDLGKTTNFVEYHGLRVWMVIAERRRRRIEKVQFWTTKWMRNYPPSWSISLVAGDRLQIVNFGLLRFQSLFQTINVLIISSEYECEPTYGSLNFMPKDQNIKRINSLSTLWSPGAAFQHFGMKRTSNYGMTWIMSLGWLLK